MDKATAILLFNQMSHRTAMRLKHGKITEDQYCLAMGYYETLYRHRVNSDLHYSATCEHCAAEKS